MPRFYTPKTCYFCSHNIKKIDYKKVEALKRYLSQYAKIESRNRTGLCAKHQRALSQAIKRARILALLPFVPK